MISMALKGAVIIWIALAIFFGGSGLLIVWGKITLGLIAKNKPILRIIGWINTGITMIILSLVLGYIFFRNI
jgi:hypothetical protein